MLFALVYCEYVTVAILHKSIIQLNVTNLRKFILLCTEFVAFSAYSVVSFKKDISDLSFALQNMG